MRELINIEKFPDEGSKIFHSNHAPSIIAMKSGVKIIPVEIK